MDHLISARTRAQAVDKAAETLSVPLPAAYREQVAQADAFADAAAQIAVTTDDLHAAVFDAIEAGGNYRTDKTVQRLTLDHQLTAQNIGSSARKRADQLLAAALSDHADDILEGWASALEPHSAALEAAAEAIPSLNLRDGHDAATHGGDVLRHWASARTAVDAWTTAERGFYALAAVAGISYRGTGTLALTPARKAELEPAFETARDARTDIDAWILARCGLPLRLATLGDFMTRAAQFNADHEAEARAEDERRKQSVANSW